MSGQLQIISIDVQAELLSSHATANAVLGDLGEGLEAPVQLLYLISLLGFVVVGAYLVVRQVGTSSRTVLYSRSRLCNDLGLPRMACLRKMSSSVRMLSMLTLMNLPLEGACSARA